MMRKIVFAVSAVIFVMVYAAAVYAGGKEKKLPESAFDLEFRGGDGMICGTCAIFKGDKRWNDFPAFHLLFDFMVPVQKFGQGFFEVGPYAKLSLIGDRGNYIPQGAMGLMAGYKWDPVEIFVSGGLAHSLSRVGDGVFSNGKEWSGQSRTTYDLGFGIRYFIKNDLYLTTGIGHNSNGNSIGINFTKDRSNPGYDYFFFGIGKRF